MKRYENECVGCYTVGLHCLGANCRNRNVPHWYCDKCKNEDRLFHFEDRELCAGCIVEEVRTETESEYEEDDVYEEYERVEGS